MTSKTEAIPATRTKSQSLAPECCETPWSNDAGSLGYLIGQAFSRSTDQIARHDPGVRSGLSPEDVHQFRVGIRRLRSDLRTYSPMIKSRLHRHLAKELRWLGAAVGPVRDGDVLMKRLEDAANALPRAEPNEVTLLLSRLACQNEAARATMLQKLESDRYGALRQTLRDLADAPPIRSRRLAFSLQLASEVAPEFVKAPWQALETGVKALAPTPSDAALHHIRILAKRARYASEAIGPAVAGAAEFAAALAAVQTVLGDHHDTVIAEAWLVDGLRDSTESVRLTNDLIFRQRSERARLRPKWRTTWERATDPELRAWL